VACPRQPLSKLKGLCRPRSHCLNDLSQCDDVSDHKTKLDALQQTSKTAKLSPKQPMPELVNVLCIGSYQKGSKSCPNVLLLQKMLYSFEQSANRRNTVDEDYQPEPITEFAYSIRRKERLDKIIPISNTIDESTEHFTSIIHKPRSKKNSVYLQHRTLWRESALKKELCYKTNRRVGWPILHMIRPPSSSSTLSSTVPFVGGRERLRVEEQYVAIFLASSCKQHQRFVYPFLPLPLAL
jgi:hypothetical protein